MIIPLITAFTILAGPPPLSIAANARTALTVQESQYNKGQQKVMIRGTISSFGINAFVIDEHTIYIDPVKTGSFRQLGTIEQGAHAEVKARRIDGLLYAEHVVIMGTGQGKTQIVLTAKPEAEKSDEDKEKEEHATVDADARTSFQIKAKGTLDQLAVYLKNALKLFASVSI